MKSFQLTNIDDKIIQGLNRRISEYTISDRSNSKWLYNKTPWVRLMSNAILAEGSNAVTYQSLLQQKEDEAESVQKSYLPFQEQSTYSPLQQPQNFSNSPQDTNAYARSLFDSKARERAIITTSKWNKLEEAFDSQSRPQPGIINVNVATKGSLGSLRSARVDFVVWTRDQLDFLEPFYFIPGMSVVLEWGWSINSTGSPVKPISIVNPIPIDSEMRNMIHRHRLLNAGDYDGLQGIITNFVYALNANGGWDCTLDIVSSADVFASAPLKQTTGQFIRHNDDSEDVVVTDLEADFISIIKDTKTFITANKLKSIKGVDDSLNDPQSHIFDIAFNSTSRDPKIDEDSADGIQDTIFNLTNGTAVVDFLAETVNEVKSFANNTLGVQISSPSTTEPFMTFDYLIALLNLRCGLKDANGTNVMVKIDISDSFVGNHFMLQSTDPQICMLIGQPTIGGQMKAASKLGNKPPIYTGYLKHILLNVYMLHELYKNSEDLKSFIQSILENVNNACGNFFEFELQEPPENFIDTKNKAITLTITNINYNEKIATKQLPTPFKFRFEDKIVRGIGVKSKMTDSMKMQALYGTNSSIPRESTDKATTNERYYLLTGRGLVGVTNKIVKNGALPFDVTVAPVQDTSPPGYEKTKLDPTIKLYRAVKKLKFERTDKTASAAATALSSWFNEKSGLGGNGSMKNKNLLLPFEIGVILDGIGGVVWGNTIDVSDFLPTRLSQMWFYQVTMIEHTIDPSGWTTTLNTLPRFKEDNA